MRNKCLTRGEELYGGAWTEPTSGEKHRLRVADTQEIRPPVKSKQQTY